MLLSVIWDRISARIKYYTYYSSYDFCNIAVILYFVKLITDHHLIRVIHLRNRSYNLHLTKYVRIYLMIDKISKNITVPNKYLIQASLLYRLDAIKMAS